MGSAPKPRTDELEAVLNGKRARVGAELSGAIQVRSASRRAKGWLCEITAQHLVSVDPSDPKLRDLYIAVPVNGSVEVGDDGTIAGASVAAPDADAVREARAFATGLIETDSVRGFARARGAGPRGRPTHEVVADASGRRVIHRIGFSGG
jgi:hypothetical protein